MNAIPGVDDATLAQAQELTGVTDVAALTRQAFRALIEREAAKTLIDLGGSQPNLELPPRRRPAG